MASDADKLGNLVVLDYGSDTIKAGLARSVPDEAALACVTPSQVTAAGDAGDARPAVTGGRVVDVDALEALLHHVLYQRLGWRPGREDCLLVIEPVLASRAEREALARLAFEEFRVRGYFVADAAACALFSVNKQVGRGRGGVGRVTWGSEG